MIKIDVDTVICSSMKMFLCQLAIFMFAMIYVEAGLLIKFDENEKQKRKPST
jgi:hypothetical protein